MDPLQKRWLVLGAGVLMLGLLVCAVSLPRLPEPAAVTAEGPAAVPAGCRCVVREYEGMVAVFLPRQLYGPKYVTGIRVTDLPQADRDQLAGGILIYTDAQLTALLQDYGS